MRTIDTSKASTSDLDTALKQCIDLAQQLPTYTWQQQSHAELSPVGWHIGHMVLIERYWVYEKVMNRPVSDKEKELYFPWLSPKHERGQQLPAREDQLPLLYELHEQTLAALNDVLADNTTCEQELLNNNYLLLFLIQHHHQHREILHQIAQQHALEQHDGYLPPDMPTATAVITPDISIAAATTRLGHNGDAIAYDNELPIHEHTLDSFHIASTAVSSAEYLGFIEDGGYEREDCWTPSGWRWRCEQQIDCPTNWRRHDNSRWYRIDYAGPRTIDGAAPVQMLSHYEAQAFARWAGFRLPTEMEWEHSQQRLKWGQCWEWCDNQFYPYPGFNAFPYEGYSRPWFDGKHYTLRGAAQFTSPWIKRPSFRNFYTADTRHIFSGLRLAA